MNVVGSEKMYHLALKYDFAIFQIAVFLRYHCILLANKLVQFCWPKHLLLGAFLNELRSCTALNLCASYIVVS